jgi:hypothetical protein
VAKVVGDPRRVIAGTLDTSVGRGRLAEDVFLTELRALSDGAQITSARLGIPVAQSGAPQKFSDPAPRLRGAAGRAEVNNRFDWAGGDRFERAGVRHYDIRTPDAEEIPVR